jgi:putative transcriptional regulator
MIETSLAPGLLLAMPQLIDPNFGRAVVLMVEHNDEGSFGLIVNQPSELTAADLVGSLDMSWGGDADERVWAGGPVQPSSGWVLHTPLPDVEVADSLEAGPTVRVIPELALSTSTEVLRRVAAAPTTYTRLILGYSGWGPGQLASEMARGSWLHADATLELLFDTPAEDMWERALRSLGIDPETIVQGRGIH